MNNLVMDFQFATMVLYTTYSIVVIIYIKYSIDFITNLIRFIGHICINSASSNYITLLNYSPTHPHSPTLAQDYSDILCNLEELIFRGLSKLNFIHF